MKKIKYLMLAMMAILATASFTACSDDDDDNVSNMERYRSAVEKTVKQQLTSFGIMMVVLCFVLSFLAGAGGVMRLPEFPEEFAFFSEQMTEEELRTRCAAFGNVRKIIRRG